jgi:DNA-binding GntR family transcriptional regulator
MIEALAIRLTVPVLTADDLAQLRLDLVAMEEAARSQDIRAWEPIHRDFHRRLITGSDAELARVIEPVAERSERYRRTSMFGAPARTWEIGNDEHEAIVAACEARDAQRASVLLARHLARSALTVLAKVAPDEEPVAVRTSLQMVQGASR